MVSLWPWKGEDNSPASFEKALSNLSTKITQATARLDVHRQHARRFKALWTLYTSFAYLLYSIILALVLGWQNWGIVEYSAVAGGPVLIYTVRTAAGRFFDYRISKTQRYLDDLQKQREETIEKLKAATKYNSTQQLLEKYGGDSPKPSRPKGGDEKRKTETKRKPSAPQPPVARTGLAPPPTANIRRPTPNQSPVPSPNPPPPIPPYATQNQPQNFPPPPPGVDEPGFAPNAFSNSAQYDEHPHWYDRLLDVLLGEDETQPKNRMVLICGTCRLVNGQAPPGIKTLEELGRWRCGNCGAWNGEESEARKVLADIRGHSQSATDPAWEPVSKTETDNHSSGDEVTDDGVIVAGSENDQDESHSSDTGSQNEPDEEVQKEEEASEPVAPRRSTRARSKGGNKKA
ncbi:hypothetical protein ASPWEDRAFT_61505 [Aspergillus wentii DTO 134E9]|uniref:Endoplasmic reticulum junction formation protein lunapark n=1 Tax=Aspergillus wentii DTO 134E9 TaxID=1073089 RepID=A0A1L9RF22_ASPWE|nr:uncharacterized protein ASPWEDRAFT_61505 [Aspergillus wentii DTO 134E9]KAI9926144.1 hypothetical protein MW887_004607 [Aspergillus wentii]OJJ33463.1 hypothetical protein ASPWEDRAFT_61505 [Aspergillus wentii DTO 134E9]